MENRDIDYLPEPDEKGRLIPVRSHGYMFGIHPSFLPNLPNLSNQGGEK